MSNENEILLTANALAYDSSNWADLSNALFDPEEGIISKAYPTREERERFVKTDEYKQIRTLINSAIEKSGLIEGSRPQKSGKFVVRLPQSLHGALETEASQEGVSLNQLVVTKLAVQLSKLATGPKPEMAGIVQAFLETRSGYSSDRVVADPDLNRVFLKRCRELGVTGTDFDINWRLFNARKAKQLTDLPKTRRYTPSKKDEFEFASEIAIRFVQQKVMAAEQVDISLDKIICDPIYAAMFDQAAQRLSPGFSALDYRWVALGLRKARRLSKQSIDVDIPKFDYIGSTLSMKASRIPTEQGIYLLSTDDDTLFVGETDNLRHRIERHVDSAGISLLPEWLYNSGSKGVKLGIAPLPSVRHTYRKTVELGAINMYNPIFNFTTSKMVGMIT